MRVAKTETVTIRVTEEEKDFIKKLAEAADITVSKFLYKVIKKEILN